VSACLLPAGCLRLPCCIRRVVSTQARRRTLSGDRTGSPPHGRARHRTARPEGTGYRAGQGGYGSKDRGSAAGLPAPPCTVLQPYEYSSCCTSVRCRVPHILLGPGGASMIPALFSPAHHRCQIDQSDLTEGYGRQAKGNSAPDCSGSFWIRSPDSDSCTCSRRVLL
jgi:hypothetical protein